MIVSNDIKTILIKAIKDNRILGKFPEITKDKHKSVTENTAKERIVVVVNATNNEEWQQTYAHIAVYVPKIKVGGELYPDTAKLTTYERVCKDMFTKRTLGYFENDTIYYSAEYIIQEDDPETWSDFINVRLKVTNENFKINNLK